MPCLALSIFAGHCRCRSPNSGSSWSRDTFDRFLEMRFASPLLVATGQWPVKTTWSTQTNGEHFMLSWDQVDGRLIAIRIKDSFGKNLRTLIAQRSGVGDAPLGPRRP